MTSLAEQLARARHELATRSGLPIPDWEQLAQDERDGSIREAQSYLDAAAAAGIAVAGLGPVSCTLRHG